MTYDNHQFFLCGVSCGVFDELGVVFCEQVGGERGVQHSAMVGDPRREVRWGCGPMQFLCKLVAIVGGCDTGGGGDGRVVAVGSAVLLDHAWEAAVAINDNDNEKS